jgi:outer membrane murein-binding lipoprotein Lpp
MEGKLARRLGVMGAAGLAAFVAAGCSSGPSKEDFNYKIDFRSTDGQRLNCFMNGVKADQRDDSVITLVDVFCPNKTQVQRLLGDGKARFQELSINFETSPQFEIQPNRPDAPPIDLYSSNG